MINYKVRKGSQNALVLLSLIVIGGGGVCMPMCVHLCMFVFYFTYFFKGIVLGVTAYACHSSTQEAGVGELQV